MEYISVSNKFSREGKQISSTSDFFSRPVACQIKKDRLVFSHVGSLYAGETMNLKRNVNGFNWYMKIDWPNGKYVFDKDDSNENEVVIYLEQ